MDILVTSAFGLEAVVKRELERLGYSNPKAINGKVAVCGTMEDVCRLNVNLRSADRVLIKLAEFRATTFEELFNQTAKVSWHNYIKHDAKVLMDGNCVKSTLGAIKASGGIIKKCIMQNLEKHYGSFCYEKGERVTVVFNIVEDVVTLCLNTSGEGLHKRGYRTLNYVAPLKETLASGLIQLSYYNKSKAFADVFCGSGTIAIETALYALNIAPNKSRAFDFEHFVGYNPQIKSMVIEQAKSAEITDFSPQIYACDINPEAIELAKYHASRAGVEDVIKFEVNDMKNFTSNEQYGVIISNPPYGDRIGEKENISNLYAEFGDMFCKLKNWNCYVLTDSKTLEKDFKRKADKKRKLYNANIECTYYSFLSAKPEKIKKGE